ncbi:MAG: polysaccharide deacetylase family protein [Anaerovoracaceae bacterium]
MQQTGTVRIPDGKKLAVNLGFDFDAFSVWMETFKQPSQAYLSRGEYGAEVCVPRILKLLDKYGLTAGFCIPGHTADSYPGVCKDIVAAGHEVMHHGYVHEDPTHLPYEEEDAILAKGIEALDRIGVRPLGYRSPGFDLSENTLKLLEKHGILYDSSLMGNDFYPYHPRVCEANFDKGNRYVETSSIVEMPVTWYLDDFPHFEFIGSRTGMKPQSQVFEIWKTYFDYGVEHAPNGMMTLTMHPQVIGRPHLITMLEELINYMLEQGAWFATLHDIYQNTTF